MNLAKYLWVIGSLILIILGFVHLILTFFSNKFSPRDPNLEKAMKLTNPILTDKLTMWSGWQGFNASHSAGILFIGLINIYLVSTYFQLLKFDTQFFLFTIFTVIFYIILATKYWFNIPTIGLIVSLFCLILSITLNLINR
jgi:hypothetical protein